MSSSDTPGPGTAVPSADDLRRILLQKQLEEAERTEKLREAEQKKHAAFTDSFLKDDVSEEERAMIRRLVMNAVKDGRMEAMVYSFPCSLCTDHGRAINNGDPGWPETLQGKAKQLYERYQTVARPQGYRLKAMIVNFPGGIPGDVGLFISWAPERF